MAECLALTRIAQLLDEGSFVEIGAQVTARITDFTLKNQMEPSDGVITGYGQIDGNPVFVYSQNREVLNGTMGEMHAKKITQLYQRAERTGAPVIGLLDCGGFRLQESLDALDAFGELLNKQAEVYGEVLQIFGIFGNCAGGMTLLPAMGDFTFMTAEANMFVNAPHTLADGKLAREFSSAPFQNQSSGQAEVLATETEVLDKIQNLIRMLEEDDYGCCEEAELNRYISQRTAANADTRALLQECADEQEFLEIRPSYYPEMVTGFLKLNGTCVGVIGNATALYDESGTKTEDLPKGLTAGGCAKAAAFMRFCNRSNYPVLTVTKADGFAPQTDTELYLPAALADLVRAFAESAEATVNLIIGDTYGSAYTAMNAKVVGAQMVFAWDGVKIGMMEAEKAANVLFADEEQAVREKQAAAYEQSQNSVQMAAARGSVDAVIAPESTRKHLIMAFSML